MLGFIGPLSLGEIGLIAVVSVLVFGKRLPQVAGQAFRQVTRLRRQLDNLRRESGIDREFRDVQDSLRELSSEATLDPRSSNPDTAPDPILADRAESAPPDEAGEAEETTPEQDRPSG